MGLLDTPGTEKQIPNAQHAYDQQDADVTALTDTYQCGVTKRSASPCAAGSMVGTSEHAKGGRDRLARGLAKERHSRLLDFLEPYLLQGHERGHELPAARVDKVGKALGGDEPWPDQLHLMTSQLLESL